MCRPLVDGEDDAARRMVSAEDPDAARAILRRGWWIEDEGPTDDEFVAIAARQGEGVSGVSGSLSQDR